MRIWLAVVLVGVVSGNAIPTTPSPPRYDTIVVGLGAAGATAASTLARNGRRVLALEAAPTIGGRVRTRSFGHGVVEEGAEWIHGTKGHRGYNLAIKNNISILVQGDGMTTYTSDGNTSHQELMDSLWSWFNQNLDNVKTDKAEPLGQYFTKSFKKYLEEKHPSVLEDTDLVNELLAFFRNSIGGHEGCSDWNEVSTQSRYTHLEGDQAASWHRYGQKTFFELLLNTYNNGSGLPNLEIKLGEEVSRIAMAYSSPVVVTTTAGTEYQADNVIVTVSLGVLKERHQTLFSRALEPDKMSAIQNISMGVVDKIILSFPKAWWPDNSTFFAFLWRKEDKEALAGDWTTEIVGLTRSMGSEYAVALWVSGDVAKRVETLPEEEVKTKSIELIRRFMGRNVTIPDPTDMIRSQWYSNPLTRGSYSFDSVDAAGEEDVRAVLARPMWDDMLKPRVLFAGEATHKTRYSTVHGASDSGFLVAMGLLAGLHGTAGHPAYNLAVKNNVTILTQNDTLRIFNSKGTEANREFIKNALKWYYEEREDFKPDKFELVGDYFTSRFRNYVNNTYPEFSNNTDLVKELLAYFRLDTCSYVGCNDWNDLSTQSSYQSLEGHHSSSFYKHGYKTFFDMLLNTYNNGTGVPNLEMKLNEEVSRITWPQDSSRPVVVTTAAGTEYQADNVIVTVSVGVLKERYQSLFSPELPQEKVDAIRNISMGLIDKIILGFPEVWWPTDSNAYGFLWRGEDKRALAGDWTTQIFELSRSMGSDHAIELWASGDNAKLIETLPEDEVKRKSMQLIRTFLGMWAEQQNITIPDPTGMIRSQWYSNPFTRGSYSFDGVAVTPGSRAALATPLLDSAGTPRVLFAGEASNNVHFATVHGAAETGSREAKRLLDYKAE